MMVSLGMPQGWLADERSGRASPDRLSPIFTRPTCP